MRRNLKVMNECVDLHSERSPSRYERTLAQCTALLERLVSCIVEVPHPVDVSRHTSARVRLQSSTAHLGLVLLACGCVARHDFKADFVVTKTSRYPPSKEATCAFQIPRWLTERFLSERR